MMVEIQKIKNRVNVYSDLELITHGDTPQHRAFALNVRKKAEAEGRPVRYNFLNDNSYECEIEF